MMNCRMIWFFLLIFLGLGVDKSFSDFSGTKCDFYFRGNTTESPIVEIFKKFKNASAIKVCPLLYGTDYLVANKIKIHNGIAYFSLSKIFKHEIGGSYSWSLKPIDEKSEIPFSVVYMCQGGEACSKHDGEYFIQTSDITIGLFYQVMEKWNRIFESSHVFDNEFLSLDEQQYIIVKSLRLALYRDDKKVRLVGIKLINGPFIFNLPKVCCLCR